MSKIIIAIKNGELCKAYSSDPSDELILLDFDGTDETLNDQQAMQLLQAEKYLAELIF